jgi:hypothetical protein
MAGGVTGVAATPAPTPTAVSTFGAAGTAPGTAGSGRSWSDGRPDTGMGPVTSS